MTVEDVLDPQAALVLLERALAEEDHHEVRAELERARIEVPVRMGRAAQGDAA